VSALAEALVAAQGKAVAALGKAYVSGFLNREAMDVGLDAMGLTDKVDQERWYAALEILRTHGGEAPIVASEQRKAEPNRATDGQKRLIDTMCKERNLQPPDGPLTFEQASNVISQIKAGEYDPGAWSVPF
jgi:hypothetical protein